MKKLLLSALLSLSVFSAYAASFVYKDDNIHVVLRDDIPCSAPGDFKEFRGGQVTQEGATYQLCWKEFDQDHYFINDETGAYGVIPKAYFGLSKS